MLAFVVPAAEFGRASRFTREVLDGLLRIGFVHHQVQGRFLAAVPLFERATALDSNFAMAYYYLSVASDNAGDIGRRDEYARKAFALIDRVSEFERDRIMAGYYESTGELDKAIDVYRLGIRSESEACRCIISLRLGFAQRRFSWFWLSPQVRGPEFEPSPVAGWL